MIHGFRQRPGIRSRSVLWLLMMAAAAAPAAAQPSSGAAARPPQSDGAQQTGAFVCPMHPDVQSKTAGTCPTCGM
ncbi:MAG TPA: heavy metal-binding domain-containing protein, partial [Gemmatimonadales bacterium]|nr:heavy metal-binding domain-containing protein [Gemmatimonadales bacterium]